MRGPLYEVTFTAIEIACLTDAIKNFANAPTLKEIAENRAALQGKIFKPISLDQQQEQVLAKSAETNPEHALLYAVFLYFKVQNNPRSIQANAYERLLENFAKEARNPHALFLLVESRINSSDTRKIQYAEAGLKILSNDPFYGEYVKDYVSLKENRVPLPHAAFELHETKAFEKKSPQSQHPASVLKDPHNDYYQKFIAKVQDIINLTRSTLKPDEKEPVLFKKIENVFNQPLENKDQREKIMMTLYKLESESADNTKNPLKMIASKSDRLNKLIHSGASNALHDAMKHIDVTKPTDPTKNGIEILDNYLKRIRPVVTPSSMPKSTPPA